MTGLREKMPAVNGGATVWSGGAIDTDKGIVYLPCGNPAPDFDASSRPGENLYSNHVIAVNISTGEIHLGDTIRGSRYSFKCHNSRYP